ncbi:hypothetical protein BXY57_1406 [Thermoflavifilum aggregans]|uniref:Uncharacterized protein n=1 Tax=Thermoflavifilum aggregans TaxID=454188 RepID=A0A2M9CV85_9BACT|nr:hypothetical protein [Thermoflavifilum aggregans]MBX6381136.1 hypothetical protein [Thermoflavifilum aggregans]PJJ75816.1 hypothetical protein BXY57_1406 [Thermoflavifilum aggregans]
MRFVLSALLAALLAFLAGYYLPWWTIAIAGALSAWLIAQRLAFFSFLSAFLAVGLLWFFIAGYIDLQNQHILSRRISELFFHTSNPWPMLILTAFTGGLTAGLGAWCGALLRNISSRKKQMTFGKFYGQRT